MRQQWEDWYNNGRKENDRPKHPKPFELSN